MQSYNLRTRKNIVKLPKLVISATQYQLIGARDYQEDCVYIGNVSKYRTLYIITDGHNGDQCSKFTIEFIKQAVTKFSKKYKDMKSLFDFVVQQAHEAWALHIFGNSKYRSPTTLAERTNTLENVIPNLGKAYFDKGGRSGTTLTCVMIDCRTNLSCFCNLGDSRVVMLKNEILYATRDHSVPKILKHLEGTEFEIFHTQMVGTTPRINGDISVAAAIGDYSHSLLGLLQSKPNINVFSLDEDAIIVLGSDGLWNTVDNQKLFINPLMDAKDVISQCRDISDNTSAILIICKMSQ